MDPLFNHASKEDRWHSKRPSDEMSEHTTAVVKSMKPFAVGAAAGLGFSLTHPLNIWKNCRQQRKEFPRSFSGLKKGYGVYAISWMATIACQNGCKDMMKEFLEKNSSENQELTTAQKAFASVFGTVTTTLILTPAERTLIGMIFNKDTSMQTTARKILSSGGPKAFFSGLSWAFMRNVPFFIGMNICGPEFKKGFEAALPNSMEPMAKETLSTVCGLGMGGFCSGLLTHPVDIVKTRVQTGAFKGRFKGMQACRAIYAGGGWRGFFMGLCARQAMCSFGPIISYSVLESFERNNKKNKET